jgi:GT2 family glycosyltransferase/ubiquinone/menaquinone biosynthesis C-methylase UbiE/Txe/YoeB family toxin of Txe-Axe toxin-antitoxin module
MEFTGERYIPVGDHRDELSVEHMHRYHSILPMVKDKVVLDIACGEGYGTALMAKTAKKVVGMDISRECIFHATQKYLPEYTNIGFSEGDVERIPAEDGVFDIIVSFETLEHVSKEGQKKFLSEVKRVLKKNGKFILSTPDIENYSNRYQHENQFHVHELNRSEFRDLITSYFKNTQHLEQGFGIISFIIPPDYSDIESVRLNNWQKKIQPVKGKYLIAIASDALIDAKAVNSVVLDTGKDYFKQVDRIIQLQNEVEDLSAWGLRLDKERIEHEAVIKSLTEQIQHFHTDYLKEISSKLEQVQQWISGEVQQKQENIQLLLAEVEQQKKKHDQQQQVINSQYIVMNNLAQRNKELEQEHMEFHSVCSKNSILEEETQSLHSENSVLKNEIQLLQSKTGMLEDHITNISGELKEKENIFQDLQFNFSLTKRQLNEANDRLVTIYDSDGWKALNKYYQLKGKYLNENSKRYKALKKVINFLRNKKEANTIAPVPDMNRNNEDKQTKNEQEKADSAVIRSIPYFENPSVSIIIPVYNAWEMNEKCLTAIIENTTDSSYEVIIADDCSTDTTKDISKYFLNCVHIRNEKNIGFLNNCNNASAYARGKYLHFLNNDTEVKSGWLSSLVMLMEKDDAVGLVGSKLIYPDGRLQEAGGIIWKDASGWNYGQGQNPGMPEFNYVKEVDYVSGASMLIRSELWKKIGGFDTAFSPAYCEDSDMAFEIRKKGFKVMFQPLSEVIHYEGYSHGSDREKSAISSIKGYQAINNRKFLEKWKAVLERDHFPNAENVFWAKDRSRFKKTMLMVDHYVPQFDKDAGSRTTFQYLELFVKLGFNVKFLGENFYKHEPYTTILQQMGIEVLYGPWYANNWQHWFRENSEKFDYIYLNRPHIAINFIDFFKETSIAKIIYYGHDLHFLREEKRYELERNETILTQASVWKEIELKLFAKSDIILTPSIDEQRVIRSISPGFNVQLMRPYLYKTFKDPVITFHQRKDLLFVGGFSHLPNVDGVLWFVKEVWPLIKLQIPGIRFIIAGSNPSAEIQQLAADPDIIVKGFVTDNELERLYLTCKLAIIPLRYGAGVKGKTVEAMYYGIPLITTSFGVEGLPGDYSFLKAVNGAEEFAREILDLYSDEERLKEQSKRSIIYMQNTFSTEVATKIICEILDTVTINDEERRIIVTHA